MPARLLCIAALATGSFASLLLTGCPDSSIASCADERDVSGAWHLALSPGASDAGTTATLTDTLSIEAQLEQGGSTDFLGLGHFVYGTLTSSDEGAFATLTIPRLTKNDGSKSGVVLGCALRINVPIAQPVSDDNVDQGPMRISLVGQIDAPGHMLGMPGSQLIRRDDAAQAVLGFAWTGTR